MKVPFPVDEQVVLEKLRQAYGVNARHLVFIPMGDSAYSYRVEGFDQERYYLKLFDLGNDRQRERVQNLDRYLPLIWKLYHHGIFQNLAYPIRALDGRFHTTIGQRITLVLFKYIEGKTLADAYPFSSHLLARIAAALSVLHYQVTPQIAKENVRRESFDISFVPLSCKAFRSLSRLPSPIGTREGYKS